MKTESYFIEVLQGFRPATVSSTFSMSCSNIADIYLNSVQDYSNLLATIVFLKHHPSVNEKILDYSLVINLDARTDTSLDVANPVEVELSI